MCSDIPTYEYFVGLSVDWCCPRNFKWLLRATPTQIDNAKGRPYHLKTEAKIQESVGPPKVYEPVQSSDPKIDRPYMYVFERLDPKVKKERAGEHYASDRKLLLKEKLPTSEHNTVRRGF